MCALPFIHFSYRYIKGIRSLGMESCTIHMYVHVHMLGFRPLGLAQMADYIYALSCVFVCT